MHFANVIDTQDRGFNYGDGFFTTAKVVDGKVVHWPLHQARLVECAARLYFQPLDLVLIEQKVAEVVADSALAVVKIVITRGVGGRGYQPPRESSATVVVSLLPYPQHYDNLANTGIELGISPIKLAKQPLLAGLKTLNRLEQVLIKQAMQAENVDDVVVLDYDDHVVETSAANLLGVVNGQIVTPALTDCGILGVYLQHLMQRLAITAVTWPLSQWQQCDALFVCNSLMQLVAVKRLGTQYWDMKQVKILARQFGLYE
ncbi:aminodeoxychorismate lyase [Pseudoalteromonas fenneropenaei]|uniref:Aminodeoxychorismate lyase n=1 Tax=Pseudoalteromonas fenneropenaei TaxID=1737459 RepID=A0ABV7CF16_9GAMM